MLCRSLYNTFTQDLLRRPTVVQADSCSATDHHTAQRLLKYNHPQQESAVTDINTDLRRGRAPHLRHNAGL